MAPSVVGVGALQRGHRRGTPQLPQSGLAQHGSAAPSVGLPPHIAHDGDSCGGVAQNDGPWCGADGGAARCAAGAAHWRVACSASTASAQRTPRLAISSVMRRVVDESCDPYNVRSAYVMERLGHHPVLVNRAQAKKLSARLSGWMMMSSSEDSRSWPAQNKTGFSSILSASLWPP